MSSAQILAQKVSGRAKVDAWSMPLYCLDTRPVVTRGDDFGDVEDDGEGFGDGDDLDYGGGGYGGDDGGYGGYGGGMGDDGIVALATGLPGAAAIEDLRLMYCNCADAGANALASAICSCPRLGKLNLSNLSQRVLDPKGPAALKLTAAVAQHRIAFPEALTKLTLTLL